MGRGRRKRARRSAAVRTGPDRVPAPAANGGDQITKPDDETTDSLALVKPPRTPPHKTDRSAREASTQLHADRDRDAAAERQETKLRKLADATRAELTRIATEFESKAAEHIERVEQMLDRVTAQGKAIEERIAELDAHAQLTAGNTETEAAATQAEASVRVPAENRTHELKAAGEIGVVTAKAQSALKHAADSRVEELEALRTALADLHRDATAAVQRSGDDQVAALDRAASAWLDRIDHAGRKRRRSVWRRRAAPPATAVMLAIAAGFAGVLWLGGSENDRSRVAAAAAPTSPPAVAVETSPADTTPPTTTGGDRPQLDPTYGPTSSWPNPTQTASSSPGMTGAPRAPTSPPATSPPAATASWAPAPRGSSRSQAAPSPPPATAPAPTSPPNPLGPVLDPVCGLTGICVG
jgi:chemotaxis protein histidine kinase CheA